MKNQIIRCKCVDMSVEGLGIAKAGELVIFVKGMIVGEEADVKIILEKKNYSVGILDKLIVKSPYRIESDCKISYKCGGCDYRYIDYDYQLVLKKKVLENTLRDFEVLDILKDPYHSHYRNKVQVPIKDHKMGFYRKNSNDIVEFVDCKIESKLANQIVQDTKSLLMKYQIDEYFRHVLIKHSQGTGEVMIGFIVKTFNFPHLSKVIDTLTQKYSGIVSIILNLNNKETNVILGEQEKVVYGRNYILDIYDGIQVKLSLKSFYQVNYYQMINLYNKVKEFGQFKKDDDVLDLYSGVGSITMFIGRYVKSATGVEIVKEAVENAKENAILNHMGNVDFILADAGKGMKEYLMGKDVVIVDPPRKGLTMQLIDEIIDSKIDRIVYVSCNPATLSRDLNLFKEYYKVSSIQPVDMFPYTVHCEAVVGLKRYEK